MTVHLILERGNSTQPPASKKRRPQQSISTPTKSKEGMVHLSCLTAHIMTQEITSTEFAPNSKPSPLHEQCWWYARAHVQDSCTLRKPCNTCKEQHLTVLHHAAQQHNQSILIIQVPSEKLYVDRPSPSGAEDCKNHSDDGKQSMETYAVLDDDSECTSASCTELKTEVCSRNLALAN